MTAPAKPVTARINEHIFLGGRHIGGLRLPLLALRRNGTRVVLDGGNGIQLRLPRTAVTLTGGHP